MGRGAGQGQTIGKTGLRIQRAGDTIDFSLPLNDSAHDYLNANRQILSSSPEIAYPFIERNISEIIDDKKSLNTKAFDFLAHRLII